MLNSFGLLSGLSSLQAAIFKKRMSQCIFATDMARHMSDLNDLKELTELIPSGESILPPGLEIEE